LQTYRRQPVKLQYNRCAAANFPFVMPTHRVMAS
jgi:hypothetical protein